MNLKYYYWWFKNAVPEVICDDIIKHGKEQLQLGITGQFGDQNSQEEVKNLTPSQVKDLKEIRNSNISWLSYPWIYNEIMPYINEANESSGWNFQFDYNEACQFTTYSKDQHYSWHCDAWKEPYSNEHQHKEHKNKIRKLSSIILLNDASEYSGGELEFDFRDSKEGPSLTLAKEIYRKGDMVVFPSFVWHRVKPVLKGQRYSLVVWSIGNPYV